MSDGTGLQLRGVSKAFGRLSALTDVSLEVGANELLVVLGATGAGKTTLLRAIVGLEEPEAGTITFGGRELTGLPPHERDMALVFQNFSLYPDWTVRRNMEFPLRAPGRRESPGEIAERVRWAADLLKITPLLERRASRLSGGEMQRVAIGRVIVRRPKLFLMDEPLTNLDAKLREALRVELTVLRRRLETPMIYVTHDQAEALSMADRIAVLAEGRVLQVGTPEEVYQRPVSPAVARQLGQPAINIIHVRIKDRAWVTEDGTPLLSGGGSGTEALVGIRPEAIAPEGGTVSARIEVVEDMGSTRTLVVRWGGCALHIAAPKAFRGRPGEVIRPRIDPAAVVWWPAR